jgi:aspartyl-tRNA(Asn)/glutamyl-tRNA(Gln) amidotransferase subunit C
MLQKEDIEHLATLARVAISEEEKSAFATQLDSVLSYVSDISKVATTEAAEGSGLSPVERAGSLRNVTRPDAEPAQGGEYTADFLANAPANEDGCVKVQKII